MKKSLVVLLVLLFAFGIAGCGEKEELPDTTGLTPQEAIETIVNAKASSFTKTDVNSIVTNENAGKEGTHIVVVNYTWNQTNHGDTSRKMLTMYSSDLASAIYEKCPTVQELAVCWNVPYLNANAKCSFERTDSGMAVMDEFFDQAFSE